MKGQLTIPAVVFMASLMGGGFVSILAVNQPIEESVKFNSGDYGEIAETKMKADNFERMIQKELNYSLNIMAVRIGSESGEFSGNGGDISWDSQSPDHSELKSEFREGVRDHLDSQQSLYPCDDPVISKLVIENRNDFSIEISNPWVSCSDRSSEAEVKVEDNYSISNFKNRYLGIAENSRRFVNDVLQKWEDESSETYTGTGGACNSRSDAEEDAAQNTKSVAANDLEDLISEVENSRTTESVTKVESNIDLGSSSDPNPVGGVELEDGDKVLLTGQEKQMENGFYEAKDEQDPSTWEPLEVNDSNYLSGLSISSTVKSSTVEEVIDTDSYRSGRCSCSRCCDTCLDEDGGTTKCRCSPCNCDPFYTGEAVVRLEYAESRISLKDELFDLKTHRGEEPINFVIDPLKYEKGDIEKGSPPEDN